MASAIKGCIVIVVSGVIAFAIQPSVSGALVWLIGCVTYRIADAAAGELWHVR